MQKVSNRICAQLAATIATRSRLYKAQLRNSDLPNDIQTSPAESPLNDSTTPESDEIVQRVANTFRRLTHRVIRSKILQDSSIVFVANMVGTVTGMLTSIITARALGPTGYGLIALTTTMVGTLVRFIDIRGNEILIRFMTVELAANEPRKAVGFLYVSMSSDIVLTLVSLGAAWIFLLPLVSSYPNGDALHPLVTIYILTIPLVFLEKSISTLAAVFKRFRLGAAIQTFDSVAKLICIAILADKGIEAVVWGYVISSALGLVVSVGVALYLFVQKFDSFRAEGYWQAWRKFLPFSFFTSFLASIQTISINADAWLIGILSPVSQISFLDLGKSAVGVTAVPVRPVNQVIFPHLNEAWAKGDIARVRYLIRRFIMFGLAISGVAALGLFLLSDLLIALLYGPEFAPAATIIRVLLIGTVLEIVFGWIRPLTVVAGKPQAMLAPSLFSVSLRIVLTATLVYLYGALGAALAYNITVVFTILMGLLFVLPQIGVNVLPKAETIISSTRDENGA